MSQGSSDHFWKSLWDDGELPDDARTLRGFLHDNVEKNLQYAMELYHEIGQGSRGWGAPWDQDVRNKGDSNERPPTWQSLFSADQNEENKSAGKILPKRIPDKNPMEFFKEVLKDPSCNPGTLKRDVQQLPDFKKQYQGEACPPEALKEGTMSVPKMSVIDALSIHIDAAEKAVVIIPVHLMGPTYDDVYCEKFPHTRQCWRLRRFLVQGAREIHRSSSAALTAAAQRCFEHGGAAAEKGKTSRQHRSGDANSRDASTAVVAPASRG